MKVAGTNYAGYMSVHRKCLIKFNAKKVNCIRELEAGASHLNTSGGIRASHFSRRRDLTRHTGRKHCAAYNNPQ